MSDNDRIEMSDEDQAQLEQLLADGKVTQRTILEIWREVLNSAESVRSERIGPGVAMHVASRWSKLHVQDVQRYHEIYHDYLIEARTLVLDEIAKDAEALERTEQDAVDNHAHYVELIFGWQLMVENWTDAWDIRDSEAHISAAALADATGFLLGDQGLMGHLREIGFIYTEAQQEETRQRLVDAKAAQ